MIQVRMGAAETFIVLAQENIRIYELYFIQIFQFKKKFFMKNGKMFKFVRACTVREMHMLFVMNIILFEQIY